MNHYGIVFEVKHVDMGRGAGFDAICFAGNILASPTAKSTYVVFYSVQSSRYLSSVHPLFFSLASPLSHSQIIVRCFRVGCGKSLAPLCSSDELYEVGFGADRGRWWQCGWVGWEVAVA